MARASSNSSKTSTASIQPPAYTEAETKIPLLRKQRSPLVVQLQVWHHSSEGRSPANNKGFAALFRNLPAWEVVPLDAEGITGPGVHDQYVPVEVRFRYRNLAYNDLGEGPMADVRELFYKIAPQFIYQFFVKIRSAPHNLNIFPVGIPDEFSSAYTHAYNLNPLSIHVNELLVHASVASNDAQSWLRDAAGTTANVLDILAAIIIVYLDYEADRNDSDRAIMRPYRQDVRLLVTLQRVQVETVQSALDSAAGPLLQYLRLASRMESRLLSLENKQVLSDQDLYELVHDSHNAVVELSAVKQAVFPLVVLLERENSRAIQAYRASAAKSAVKGAIYGLAAAIAAVFLLSNPGGWAVCGAGLIGGVAGASLGLRAHWLWGVAEQGKAFGKRDRVKACEQESRPRANGRELTTNAAVVRLAVKQLDMYASQAQVAIAMVFCAQVMRKRIDETLPEHDRRAILASFGVDANDLGSAVYREELVRLRLSPFREWNGELRKKMNEVMADVNYELSE
ncbi:hypothetical protein CPLU01_08872 [Colletotrichum plurivorum]|uniref:Uncharacterized protein n=1 Tax=Colletotrichum plurivorum TaxID=2175906 RepID=A0A8H6NCJ3_9PEZI|nr:hypothetical protein CPLU01_08872 [Colletotrichum plurivorum]